MNTQNSTIDDESIYNIILSAYPNKKTADNYVARLKTIKQVCHVESIYDVISNPQKCYAFIRSKYPNINTRKNVITVLLVIFKHSTLLSKRLQKEQIEWKKFHDMMNSLQEAKYKKSLPDPHQLAKYTTSDEMFDLYKKIKSSDNPHKTLTDSQRFLILSMAVHMTPKRADLHTMKIYYEKDPNISDANYLVLRRNASIPSYMVFNVYKTAKQYKRVDDTLPYEFYKDVMDSLRIHPRDYLFINIYKKPFGNNNAFTKFVIRTFEHLFGRRTGVTMLRHIFITEKVDMNESEEYLEEISQKMMHSKELQRKYNWSKKAICERMQAICGIEKTT